jgi:transposase
MDELHSTVTQSPPVDDSLLEKLLSNRLSEAEALKFASENPECIAFTLLALQQRLAGAGQTVGPNTPSSVVPPYQKPSKPIKSNAKGKKKRGGQPGHAGCTRDPLPAPDRTREHQSERCPDCNGELVRTGNTRSRRSEDIPEDLKPVITEDVIHRDYCPNCKKQVEPKLPDVLPNCTLGNRTLVLATLLHFLQGLSIGQIVDTFNFHLRMKVTPGGLVQMWHRLADLLFVWYEQIHHESLESATLHADETGWRVSGTTHWLWCFNNSENVFYMIDRSRGSPALAKFFSRAFEGTLITDFWSPYEAVVCADKQKCWPHLLRDVAAVDEVAHDHQEWKSFSRRLVGVYRDAKKLHPQRATMAEEAYDMAVARLEGRISNLASEKWEHPDANRLAKRLSKHGYELLTFLWHSEVPMSNNAGERAIRPAVMIRKNSYCNHSDRGALTQSVLMSVLRTLRVRGHQPLDTILSSLADYSKSGKLPPLPPKSIH